MNKRQREARFSALKMLPCLACEVERVPQPSVSEIHHLNFSGWAGKTRLGDEYTVVLCQWHHRSVQLPGVSRLQMIHKYGPSMPGDKTQFHVAYGSDEQLLENTNAAIARLEMQRETA
jgi:hypothetical protein